ncbi:MAG TPA: SIR2 family protein [Rhodanobacteraceae bacterium]|nr:SIR2 family protein [Rhodanobacteraceae bacterium]
MLSISGGWMLMALNEIKKHLQGYFSDGLVTIVGSGLSCAEGLPSMGEVADHLCDTIGAGLDAADQAGWAETIPLIKAKGLEYALQERVPTPTLELAITNATASMIADRERQVITSVFNSERQLRLTRLLGHMLKPSFGLPIVTTNYDRLVEVAVEEAGIGADTMFVGRFAGSLNERESKLSFCHNVTYKKPKVTLHYRPRALIYKPHGSIDWYLRGDKPVFYAGDLPDARRLIITPGQNKFRNGYESPFDHHRARANDAIDRASRFLILGYGFNDDHLETHLSTVIKGGMPALILSRTLTSNASAIALANGNVTALERYEEGGIAGTRLIFNKTRSFLPGLALWDVNLFIDEVLEP